MAITESLFTAREKQMSDCQGSNNLQAANKRKNYGNPTVQTECSATGLMPFTKQHSETAASASKC